MGCHRFGHVGQASGSQHSMGAGVLSAHPPPVGQLGSRPRCACTGGVALPPAAYSQWVARALCCGWVGCAGDRMGCALPALFGLGCGGPTLLPAWPWRAASRGSSPQFFLFHGDEWTEPTMTEIGHVSHYFLSKSFSLRITKPRHRCRAEVYYHQS